MIPSNTGFRNKFVRLKTGKRRKTSSNTWLRRQLNDPFVGMAKLDGYRSRAAYKLIEINEKFKLFKPGMKLVDLGAAPGGWSQIAAKLVKADEKNGSRIVAIDLLEMEEISGVTFFQKNFFDADAASLIKDALKGNADVVMSDMAANTTGHPATDHLRIMDLCEGALNFALTIIKPGGHFIAKIFRGGLENHILNIVKQNFSVVKHFKPASSRKESTEFYLVAMNRKAIDENKDAN